MRKWPRSSEHSGSRASDVESVSSSSSRARRSTCLIRGDHRDATAVAAQVEPRNVRVSGAWLDT